MADELDAFLKEGTRPDGAPTMPAEPPAEHTAPEAPSVESKALTTPTEAPAKASEPEPEEDVAVHAGSDNRTVPFSALEKVRNDWKSKYAAEQARAQLLAQQLEEAKRPPPPPAAPPPQMQFPPPPDPQVDPIGYMRWELWQQQQAMLNDRLNLSEEMVRDKIGKEKLDEYVSDFKAFAAKDETLFKKLHAQPAPYQWLVREVDSYRARAEIGDDPTAFEQKLRAKIMAELEASNANGNGQAMPQRPGLPAQPPSLATARSVAGRTTSTFTGPPALSELFPGVEARRRAR